MNRLQTKCLYATVGFHLLLVLILVVGPGFFRSTPKPDDTQVLDVIPTTAIEAALNSGVKDAQPPAPTPLPPLIPPPKPIVLPPPPQPQPQPTPPTPEPPAPSFVKRMENFFKPEPAPEPVTPAPDDSPKPAEHKHEHKVNVDMSTVQRSTVEKSQPHHTSDDSQQRAAEARETAIASAVSNLEKNFKPSTRVEMPGSSSVSYASYASIIKSIYTREWQTPANAANDEANVKVSVTVSSDGTVISAHIIEPSGDSNVDDSVQQTLDRVTFIAPFPDGATEKEKTFIINFNLKAKRMLG
jgi:periplasmic protein TonB